MEREGKEGDRPWSLTLYGSRSISGGVDVEGLGEGLSQRKSQALFRVGVLFRSFALRFLAIRSPALFCRPYRSSDFHSGATSCLIGYHPLPDLDEQGSEA